MSHHKPYGRHTLGKPGRFPDVSQRLILEAGPLTGCSFSRVALAPVYTGSLHTQAESVREKETLCVKACLVESSQTLHLRQRLWKWGELL